jgi:hypothetical protein
MIRAPQIRAERERMRLAEQALGPACPSGSPGAMTAPVPDADGAVPSPRAPGGTLVEPRVGVSSSWWGRRAAGVGAG